MIYSFGGLPYDLGARTRIMGILNVTPDSFSDGGRYTDRTTAVEHALEMAGEGADFIDIGGESTRPGATPVAPDVEIRRVVPVIEALAAKSGIPISVDTRNADVAERALGAGASIVNDISGLRHDPRMAGVVGTRGGSAVLMHMRGTSATMQDDPRYDDIIGGIRTCFLESIRLATEAGIRQIILDPGIGFGKTTGHNLEILSRLGEFADLGYPLMVGPSRKAFVGAILELPVGERLEGTIGASVAAVMRGARLLRVHDVREVSRAVRIADAILARNHA